jgi:hypothetical protein
MIANDHELNVSLERIRHLQDQVAHLRQVETNPANYHLSAAGFLAEIDRMQLEVREYLSLHPGEPVDGRRPRWSSAAQSSSAGGATSRGGD